MTVGDVNATIWAVGTTGVTLWAAIVGAATIFPKTVHRAATFAEQESGKTLGGGIVVALTAGILGLILVNQPNGLFKLIGFGFLAALFALAVLGSAGLATVAGERVGRLDSRLSPLGSIGRGAAFLVAAGFFPFVGWMLFFPAMFILSLGGRLAQPCSKEKRWSLPDVASQATQ